MPNSNWRRYHRYYLRWQRRHRLHPDWSSVQWWHWARERNRTRAQKIATQPQPFCKQCGDPIDEKKWRKKGPLEKPQFCCRACDTAWRRENGFYNELSAQGNEAQRQFKAKNGHAPGYRRRLHHVKVLAAMKRRRRKNSN